MFECLCSGMGSKRISLCIAISTVLSLSSTYKHQGILHHTIKQYWYMVSKVTLKFQARTGNLFHTITRLNLASIQPLYNKYQGIYSTVEKQCITKLSTQPYQLTNLQIYELCLHSTTHIYSMVLGHKVTFTYLILTQIQFLHANAGTGF